MKPDRNGFALIAVLLVLALLGIVGAEFAYSMRLEASAVRAYKETLIAAHLAEAGVEQAIREMVADVAYASLPDDGVLTFYNRERGALPRLPRDKVPLGSGAFSYRITDEESRINVNTSPPDRLDRLLDALGLKKEERDTIVDSIQDWRDANEEHRLNGAESDDTYLELPVPYRARNANIEALPELLQIKGITRELYNGVEGRPGLADAVTVKSPGQININTVTPIVLRALAFSDAEITEILQARRDFPYNAVPPRFSGRGLVTTSRTFRIEAEGIVEGQTRARLTAVVQKRTDQGAPTVAILEWSGIR
jgi:general secretion pathway protein K